MPFLFRTRLGEPFCLTFSLYNSVGYLANLLFCSCSLARDVAAVYHTEWIDETGNKLEFIKVEGSTVIELCHRTVSFDCICELGSYDC